MSSDRIPGIDRPFIAWSIVLAAIACGLVAVALVKVTEWYLLNCPGPVGCGPARWLIHYWWIVFLPVCLGCAWWLRRIYDRRQLLNRPPPT